MQQTFNDKKVIWESKRRQVGLIAVSFLFVAATIWTRDKSTTDSGSFAEALIGGVYGEQFI
jgi:hypothetical protein